MPCAAESTLPRSFHMRVNPREICPVTGNGHNGEGVCACHGARTAARGQAPSVWLWLTIEGLAGLYVKKGWSV